MLRLMIKEHTVTGLKYLCITEKESWVRYLGSGSYWRHHLERHGKTVKTTVIYCDDDRERFSRVCLFLSEYFGVVESDEWANLIPEDGINTQNARLLWEALDDESRREFIERRAKRIKECHWSKSDRRGEIVSYMSEMRKRYCESLGQNERDEMASRAREGLKWFYDDEERVEAWKHKLSEAQIKRCAEEDPVARSDRIRKGRLSMSDEAKEARKEKIQAVWATGKHDHLFEKMSEERKGSGNPAARRCVVDGVEYGSLKEAADANGVTYAVTLNRFKSDKWPNWIRL